MKQRILILMIVTVFSLTTYVTSFAATDTIILKEEFTPKSTSDLTYEAKKTITKDGKKYNLKNVKTAIIENPEITITKKVTTINKSDYPKEIVEEGTTLNAPATIEWKEEKREPEFVTKKYYSRAEVPDSVPLTVKIGDKEYNLTAKQFTEKVKYETQNINMPGTFYGIKGSTLYEFNGKTVNLDSGEPIWPTYQSDIKDYLDISKGSIDGSSWSSEEVATGEETFTRTATFTGTEEVPYWEIRYKEDSDYDNIYTAEIKYEGTDPNKKLVAEATMTYERDSSLSLTAKIAIGIGLLLLAALISFLLFYLKKKKGGENE